MLKGSRLASVPFLWLCCVPLFLSLWSGASVGLGFGTIKLYSYLNEPLDAEIELVGADEINTSNLLITLAPAADFEKIHMARPYFLTKLRFEVVQQGDRTFISVQSDEPVKRAFLEFLVLLHWPEGRLVRSYTLLFDPAPIGKISRRMDDNPKQIASFSQDKLDHSNKSVPATVPDLKTLNRNASSALENLFETNTGMSTESNQTVVPQNRPLSVSVTQQAVVDKAKIEAQAFIAESKALADMQQKHQAELAAQKESAKGSSFSGVVASFWHLMKLSLKAQKWLWSASVAAMMLGLLTLVYFKRFKPRLALSLLSPYKEKTKKNLLFFDQEFSIRMELAKHYAAIKDFDSAKQVLETMLHYGNQREKQAAQDLSDRLFF
ncbi:MAG: hypothetical protein KBD23_03765 [Gammaproteobacteria bacterium]|nr:hypothetical protein [Gammaproteobacteria bacterium]MBP9729239.1 hypothetical protein [Gammaproteobacteria bacterium]